jgi:hypothetical protein
LAASGEIKVTLFSLALRKILEADFPNVNPGTDVSFNLTDKSGVSLANGLYYVRIQWPAGQSILKLLILR